MMSAAPRVEPGTPGLPHDAPGAWIIIWACGLIDTGIERRAARQLLESAAQGS